MRSGGEVAGEGVVLGDGEGELGGSGGGGGGGAGEGEALGFWVEGVVGVVCGLWRGGGWYNAVD